MKIPERTIDVVVEEFKPTGTDLFLYLCAEATYEAPYVWYEFGSFRAGGAAEIVGAEVVSIGPIYVANGPDMVPVDLSRLPAKAQDEIHEAVWAEAQEQAGQLYPEDTEDWR